MKRKDIKMFDRFLFENLLKESYNLYEALEISNEISKILQRYGYDIPTDVDIQKIEPSKQDNMFDVTIIDKQGREKKQQKKITKLLKQLYPSIDLTGSTEVQTLINELRLVTGAKQERYKFEIYDDVAHWYKKLKNEYGVGSCVVDGGRVESGETDRLLRGIEKLPELQIVVLWDNEKKTYIGRALLWHGVTGAGKKTYLDRTYPGSSEPIHSIYINWAEKQGYNYRTSMNHDGYQNINNKTQRIKFNCGKIIDEDIVTLPYMDTFRWCTVHPKTGKMWFMNYKPSSSITTVHKLGAPAGVTVYTKPTCDLCGKALKRTQEIHHTAQYKRVCNECFANFHNCKFCDRNYKTNGKIDELNRHDNMTELSTGGYSYICRNCASKRFKQCAKCGKYDFKKEYREFINKNGQTQYICAEDAEKHGVETCGECNAYSENIKTVVVGGDKHFVCNKCGDKFIECRNCHNYFYGNDLWYSNNYLFTSCFCDPCFQEAGKAYKKKYGDDFYNENIKNGFTFFDDLDEDNKNTIRKKSVVKEGSYKTYNDVYTTILAEMSEHGQL